MILINDNDTNPCLTFRMLFMSIQFHCKHCKRAPEKLARPQRGWRLVPAILFLGILEASIVENGFKIRQDYTRIKGLIRTSCSRVKSKCRQLKGPARV